MNSVDIFLTDFKKYFDYFFETKGFVTDTDVRDVSAHALAAAKQMRGADRGPALLIHGIMPRSGTVYVGELLRRHPALYAYSRELWEFPALRLTKDVQRLQKRFYQGYKPGVGRLGDDDFLPLFGASLIAYLHGDVPPQRRLLAKMPSVQYLSHFQTMFPHEQMLILVRDGRDVVHSTLKTWSKLNFLQVALRWNRSARIVLDTVARTPGNGRSFLLVKFEDVLQDPVTFIERVSTTYGLDAAAYPYDEIESIRVIGSSKLEKKSGQVSWQHLKRPKNFKPTAYWQNWSPLKKKIFKLVAGNSLRELGYCDDLNW